MEYPIHINITSMEVSIFRSSQKFYKNGVFLSLKVVFSLTNNADPVEMLHKVTFHLGLHSLPK